MINWVILSGLIFSSSVFASNFPVKPDPQVTFGDYCSPDDPHFDGYRYPERIAHCARTKNASNKRRAYELYNVPTRCRREYTVDHFIPLSMGGSNALENLWPEHRNVKATRQNLENEIFDDLAAGLMEQAEAVNIIIEAKMNPPVPIESSSCD